MAKLFDAITTACETTAQTILNYLEGRKFTPSSHTHTPAEAGALPANGTAADAAKLGGKLPKYYDRPRNLLDNSDFRNPVNQRGATTTTEWAYCIDRWLSMAAGVGLAFGASGMTVTGVNASGNAIYQKIANHESILGKAVTLAVKHTGSDTPIIINCILPSAFASTSWATYATKTVGNVMIDIFSSNGSLGATISVTNQSSVTFEWAALYEGTYTLETLPSYVPKGYAAELAECQRYYWQYQHNNGMAVGTAYMNATTEAYVTFAFPQTMRITPTISIDDISTLRLMCVDGMKGVTAYTVNRGTPNQLSVTFTTNSSGTIYTPCVMRSNSGTIIAFSADL